MRSSRQTTSTLTGTLVLCTGDGIGGDTLTLSSGGGILLKNQGLIEGGNAGIANVHVPIVAELVKR